MLLSPELFFGTVFLLLAWLIAVSFLLFRIINHYRRLTAGTKEKDWGSVLEKIREQQEDGNKKIVQIEDRVGKTEKEGSFHIQKIGLVRFNPFSETGGDQSFTLAALDENNSGFIISSLHSRDNTRIYAKPVLKGSPQGYDFSKEEKEAISKASKQ